MVRGMTSELDSHVVLMRHRLLALDRRYLFALPNITVGRVTREIVSELQQIAVEYDELLKGELSVLGAPQRSDGAHEDR